MIIRAPQGSTIRNLSNQNGLNEETNINYSYVKEGFDNIEEKS